MTALRFAVGDRVAYAEQQFPDVVWTTDYRIMTVLAADMHGPRYKIRSGVPVFDRIVREPELLMLPQEGGGES